MPQGISLLPGGRMIASRKIRRVLLVHPSGLMYSEVYLRLEPLGLELVAAACLKNGYLVRLLDLQASTHKEYFRTIHDWRPDAVGYSLNYLANIPEVVDLATATRRELPEAFLFAGGHSASFTAAEILEHAGGALDCVVKGEGEGITPRLLRQAEEDRRSIETLPGIVTLSGSGPPAELVHNLDDLTPARDLLPKRRKYFIGVLDPAASVEFTRGCPWDCVFCSAWTFYGRTYRHRSPEAAAADLARITEPGVFIVDDVAFIQGEHGYAIAKEIEKRKIKKQYYLETRADVLVRNKEVFRYWKRLGLEYLFLGIEAIDEEGLQAHRKRVTVNKNLEALECARELGIVAAINIIADPSWNEQRFAAVRGAAYQAAVGGILSAACRDAGSTEQEVHGLGGTGPHARTCAGILGAGADQFREDAVEVQQRLQLPAPDCRSSTRSAVQDAPSRSISEEGGPEQAVRHPTSIIRPPNGPTPRRLAVK